MSKPIKRKPVIDGDWRLIGPSPDLAGVISEAAAWKQAWEKAGRKTEHNAPVDHHLFQDGAGAWHLWGCVRATAVGRILYHWKSDDFLSGPWQSTEEFIRVDRALGESAATGEECIQSPFFVNHDGIYYMFYGGGPAGPEDTSQMCLMTSEDGRAWKRHINQDGQSRLFAGPGPARDPCVVKIGRLWHLYYAGSREGDIDSPVFWCRTSADLLSWSDPLLIHEDASFGNSRWSAECPHVVARKGCYYLFRTENYYESRTHVFRSTSPIDFGIGDAALKYVGLFPAAAPEIYLFPDGTEYVSSNHNPPLGIQICRMKWVEESDTAEP